MDPNRMTSEPRNAEFDFFLGRWSVAQRVAQVDGRWSEFPATTEVVADLDGTVLVEHWEGETLLPWEGMTEPEHRKALSVRAFDPVKQVWNIHWIDNRNRAFIPTATGRFANGRGEFRLAGIEARIVFEDIHPDRFHWRFDVHESGNWQPKWIMDMARQRSA